MVVQVSSQCPQFVRDARLELAHKPSLEEAPQLAHMTCHGSAASPSHIVALLTCIALAQANWGIWWSPKSFCSSSRCGKS